MPTSQKTSMALHHGRQLDSLFHLPLDIFSLSKTDKCPDSNLSNTTDMGPGCSLTPKGQQMIDSPINDYHCHRTLSSPSICHSNDFDIISSSSQTTGSHPTLSPLLIESPLKSHVFSNELNHTTNTKDPQSFVLRGNGEHLANMSQCCSKDLRSYSVDLDEVKNRFRNRSVQQHRCNSVSLGSIFRNRNRKSMEIHSDEIIGNNERYRIKLNENRINNFNPIEDGTLLQGSLSPETETVLGRWSSQTCHFNQRMSFQSPLIDSKHPSYPHHHHLFSIDHESLKVSQYDDMISCSYNDNNDFLQSSINDNGFIVEDYENNNETCSLNTIMKIDKDEYNNQNGLTKSTLLIFVYGTLKRGYCNHYNLETNGASYFQDGITIHPYVFYLDSNNRSRPCLADGSMCPINHLIHYQKCNDQMTTNELISKVKSYDDFNNCNSESLNLNDENIRMIQQSPRCNKELVCLFCRFFRPKEQIVNEKQETIKLQPSSSSIDNVNPESTSQFSLKSSLPRFFASKPWGWSVRGELYRIDISLLTALDQFERVPSNYIRQTIIVKGLNDNELYHAEVYFNNTTSERWCELLDGRFPLLRNYTRDHHRLYQPRDGNHLGHQRKLYHDLECLTNHHNIDDNNLKSVIDVSLSNSPKQELFECFAQN